MPRPNDVVIDAVGVGAPKCGTTWLAACLAEHPMLCVARPSALNYFSDRMIWPEFRAPSGLGPEWLAERFSHCREGQRRIEITPNYLYDGESARRIFAHNPRCHLLFTFRHPVEMLVSFYFQIAKESPVPDTFGGLIQAHPEIRRIGLYYRHLQAFLDIFPREQCLFVLFDDVQHDPAAVVENCFSFLQVTRDFRPPSLKRRLNERRGPRSKVLAVAINKVRHFVQDHTSKRLWNSLVWKSGLYRLHDWMVERNLKPIERAEIDLPTRESLLQYFREDTRSLGRFLGRDLSSWER